MARLKTHDPAECRRLVAEVRSRPAGDASWHDVYALADQLEAACHAIDRLHDHDERRSDTVAKLDAECRDLTAERDALRAEVERRDKQASLQAQIIASLSQDAADRTAERDSLRQQLEAVQRQKDGAYSERDRCVAALARLAVAQGWTCGISRHEETDESWDRDWMNIVYIDFPTGQCSWHIHDSELAWFAFLPRYERAWDGHTTDQKYERATAPVDLAAAQRRIVELESERDRAVTDMNTAEQQMLCVLDGTFSIGDGTAQRHIEHLTTERDALRKQLELANKLLETECSLSMSTTNAMLRAQTELAAAQRRIAELEADLARAPGPGVKLDLHLADKRIDELRTAILAVWPAFRVLGALADPHAQLAYNTARAAITPEITRLMAEMETK